jgi:flavin-dependent dehydrogenase
MTDVVIAGAGIAGSALAIALARQGKEVTLLDRAEFPREKACGEGLMPAGVDALARLGVAVRGMPFHGVRYVYAGRTAQGRFPESGAGLGVRRHHLDQVLIQTAAGRAGVRVIAGTAVDSPLTGNGAIAGVRAGGVEYRARLTIAADGANSKLRHKLGWDAPPRWRRFGIRRHFRLPPARPVPDSVTVYLARGHEVYVTPLPDGEMLVAVLRDQQGSFAEAVASHRELQELLSGAEVITPQLGAAPLTVRARRRWAPGFLLLGDAAGRCDPITGGGMSQALLSAELLAAHLSERFPPSPAELEAYDRQRERMLADWRRLTAMMLGLARRPSLIAPALSAMNAWPRLFSHLLGVAGGTRPLVPWPTGRVA